MSFSLIFHERKIELLDVLFKYLDLYVNEIIEDPRRIYNVVDQILKIPVFGYLLSLVSMELLSMFREKPEEITLSTVKAIEELKEKLREIDPELCDKLELALEHDILRLRLLIDNPEKFFRVQYDLIKSSEFMNYIRIYVGALLLLYALYKMLNGRSNYNKDKFLEISKLLKEFVEELDSYTATFEYYLIGEHEDEDDIEHLVRDEESLRKAIG